MTKMRLWLAIRAVATVVVIIMALLCAQDGRWFAVAVFTVFAVSGAVNVYRQFRDGR